MSDEELITHAVVELYHGNCDVAELIETYVTGGDANALVIVYEELGREPTDCEWRRLLEGLIRAGAFGRFLSAVACRMKGLSPEEVMYYRRFFLDVHAQKH